MSFAYFMDHVSSLTLLFYLKMSAVLNFYTLMQHYSELPDIKRVIVNTHAIEPQSLVEFFGTLSKEWALECMKDLLLVNLRGNLQIIVQVHSLLASVMFKISRALNEEN